MPTELFYGAEAASKIQAFKPEVIATVYFPKVDGIDAQLGRIEDVIKFINAHPAMVVDAIVLKSGKERLPDSTLEVRVELPILGERKPIDLSELIPEPIRVPGK